MVELTEVSGGVKVVVRVDNVAPGLHGVHITEFADCSSKDATSAGHHFNPDDNPHARRSEEERHLGDLGNLQVKAPDRSGQLVVVVPQANLVAGAPRSFLNRALVVHADRDNGKHQPGGDSGQRIGCAELTIAAAKTQPSGKLVMAR
jgi:Cu-Zn family superoxide dismutase